MKKLKLVFAMCIVSTSIFAQKVDEKSAMSKTKIDFKKEYLFFELSGKIEIDGHTVDNKKRPCPLIYKADLDGVTIIDTCNKVMYVNRKCDIDNCDVIHLKEAKTLPNTILGTYPRFNLIDVNPTDNHISY